ncbi:hypothetical protein SEA_VANLEE_47 [Gordonia phage VanLee]|uniref:Uncharacterized protein n=1 Tax=Gordonia phage VanLee TaxID=2845816 RepID=A0A8F2DA67_9CAUD|nr:hypothetical protein QEH49_gp047 [Gordonia phage VanLee]QWS68164.1 hypothetical protein SEA_VANLEE_47 [Gordonia phage VanLee]
MEGTNDEARRALERVQFDDGFESLVNSPIGRTGAWVEYPCMCGGIVRLESTRLTDGTWTEPKQVHA